MKKINADRIAELITTEPENIIRKEGGKELYDKNFEFHKHIDIRELRKFLYSLPFIIDSDLCDALENILGFGEKNY